jgi:polysaccharide export outer membrane protein
MNKAFVCSATLAAALLIFGCTASMLSEAEQQSLAAAATAAPKLQPGDKIRVNVFGEDKLSGDYEIDQSGQISLPLAGTVEALGLTQADVAPVLCHSARRTNAKSRGRGRRRLLSSSLF